MRNPIIIGADLKIKRSALETLNNEVKAIKIRAEEVTKAIDGAETEEDLTAIEASADEIQAELDTKLAEKSALEEEIAKLEAVLEEVNNKVPSAGGEGERNMGQDITVRDAIKGYVRSKGTNRAGFTSVEGGALIPEELLSPQVTPSDVVDLSKLVNVAKVNSGAGKYPVIKKSGSKMVSVAELAVNPELAKPNITSVAYDIVTYRGYIPVSQEAIDDADYDVTGLIADEIKDQELVTKNFAIATILKTATAKAVAGIDGLKKVFNVDLKRIYTPKAILTASLFNALDTTKDLNGRYLLQDDITVASGKKLFGYEVVVLDDTVIGTAANDLKGFIGDPKAFATLFDRSQVSVKWVDNDVYGQLLASFIRFDAKKVDSDAGFYITYTAAV